LLGLETVGADSGCADILADYIKDSIEGQGKIFFPKGNLAKATIGDKLESYGFSVDHLVVYDTEPNKNIEKLVANENRPDWAVFFSPSGATSSLPIMNKIYQAELHKIKLVAIGPTTKKEIESLGFEVLRTASKPNPEAVKLSLVED